MTRFFEYFLRLPLLTYSDKDPPHNLLHFYVSCIFSLTLEGLKNMSYVLIGLGFYVVCMLAIGLYSRKVGTTEDFIVAGKRLSLPLCTATLAATWFWAAFALAQPVQLTKEAFWRSLPILWRCTMPFCCRLFLRAHSATHGFNDHCLPVYNSL